MTLSCYRPNSNSWTWHSMPSKTGPQIIFPVPLQPSCIKLSFPSPVGFLAFALAVFLCLNWGGLSPQHYSKTQLKCYLSGSYSPTLKSWSINCFASRLPPCLQTFPGGQQTPSMSGIHLAPLSNERLNFIGSFHKKVLWYISFFFLSLVRT